MASDAHLVALVRQGWPSAFETLYGRYHRSILSFCRHMLGDPEEAADAVQHTFLAAYNAIVSSEKTILLRAWLFTIARNRCYSVLRAKREQPLEEFFEPATEGLSAQVQRREDLRQLLSDMRGLPDNQRAALVMAELGTLSHQEIGTALGVPPTKVKALVFQARESLIASRTARDTDCTEIREQLSTLHGGALRRANLRRHLRECQGCREFRTQVSDQRRSLAAILPVVPAAALKDAVLGGVSGTSGTSGVVAGGGLLASTLFKGIALKGAMSGLLALIGTAGTIALVHPFQATPTGAQHAALGLLAPSSPRPAGSVAGASSTPARAGVAAGASGRTSASHRHSGHARSGAGSSGGGARAASADATGSPSAVSHPSVPAASGVPTAPSAPVSAPLSAPTPSAPAVPAAPTPSAPAVPATPTPPASTPTTPQLPSPPPAPLPPAPGVKPSAPTATVP
jgi:RNA polymerase sigma factor (sigma-70 family)